MFDNPVTRFDFISNDNDGYAERAWESFEVGFLKIEYLAYSELLEQYLRRQQELFSAR